MSGVHLIDKLIDAARVALPAFVAGAAATSVATQLAMNPLLACVLVGTGVLTAVGGVLGNRAQDQHLEGLQELIQALCKQQGDWKRGFEDLLIEKGIDLTELPEAARRNPLARFYLLMAAPHEQVQAFLEDNTEAHAAILQVVAENSAAVLEHATDAAELLRDVQGELNMVQHKLDEQAQAVTRIASDTALVSDIVGKVSRIDSKLDSFIEALRASSCTDPNVPAIPGDPQLLKRLLPLLNVAQSSETSNAQVSAMHLLATQSVDATMLLPPPSVEALSPRANTVNQLADSCLDGNWLAIRGESGSGKTQLVGLLQQKLGRTTIWVRLRQHNAASAASFIDAVFQSIRPRSRTQSFFDWVRSTLQAQGSPVLIVLDDLPGFQPDSSLAQRLRVLITLASDPALSFVTTSTTPIPSTFKDSLEDALQEVECPPFDHTEAVELLHAHGAPSQLLASGIVRFLCTMTHGNPLLLAAAARFLQQHGWRFSEAEFEALLAGEHTRPIHSEMLDRVITTVIDPDTRSLLYRLRLMGGTFSAEDVDTVASVHPVIERPIERLGVLTGLWVQREASDRFNLSPLCRVFTEINVPAPTRIAVHLALGSRLVRQQVLDPWDLARAITHFVGAKRYTSAGMLLMRGLESVLDNKAVGDADLLLLMWGSTSLPQEMPLTLQVFLRAHQIAAQSMARIPTEFLIDDLVGIEARLPDADAYALISIMAVASRPLARTNLHFLHRVLLRIVSLWHTWRDLEGRPLPEPEGVKPGALLWTTVDEITTRDDLGDWLSTVRQLDETRQAEVFQPELALDLCINLADRLWMVEHEKPDDERDWAGVHEGLEELMHVANELGQPYLWACALRAKIAVLSEYEQDLDGAITVAREELSVHPVEEASQFLIQEFIGRQCLFQGKLDQAREWYSSALDKLSHGSWLQQVLALMNASRAFGGESESVARDYAERGVEASRNVPGLAPTLKTQVYGELAVARWLDRDPLGTYRALDEAAEALIASRERDESWKGLFVFFAHSCAYYAGVTRCGEPPLNSDDGSPLTEPYRGFFVRSHDEAAGLWGDKQSMGVFSQLALLGEGVGDDEGVHKWAQRGMDAARSAQLPAVTAVYADLCLVPEVVTGNLEAVIELAFETARTTAVAEHLEREGQRALWEGFDVDALLEDLDDSTRDQANRNAIMVIAFPFAFHLAQRVLVEGFADTEMVERLCEGIQAGVRAGPGTEYAVEACDVLREVFVDGKAGQDLAEAAAQREDWLMQSIAYIGPSLDGNVPLTTAYFTQLAVAWNAAKVSGAIVGLDRRLVLPFLECYWDLAFRGQRFRFSSPRLIEADLHNSVKLPVHRRIRAIFRTIGAGLGIKPPPYAREWLFEARGDVEV